MSEYTHQGDSGLTPSRLVLLLLIGSLVATGCSRQRHRLRADRDAHSLLSEKTACTPWTTSGFQVDPLPGSRLAHGSCPDDPCLPAVSPSLYAFQVPETAERPSARFSQDEFGANALQEAISDLASRTMLRFPPEADRAFNRPFERPINLLATMVPNGVELANYQPASTLNESSVNRIAVAIAPAEDDEVVPPEPRIANDPIGPNSMVTVDEKSPSLSGIAIVPINEFAWESIPRNCLRRTIEFNSVKQEYQRTFQSPVDKSLLDSSERLALEDLLELAVQHSREYQTQKETLYRTALRLSLERYAFQLKFLPTGNGSDVDWRHSRNGGITENGLGIASGVAVDKVLATGGNLLARFANDVVLTFNGPTGFATDVSSELFAELTQPLIQRDIVFESLTQAERDLVYAARSYARFRKEFFRDIASDYYRLLLTYRSIEIDMLDYFANQRGFDQSKYEYELLEKIPRFQVDQFEQNTLNSRSSVIRSCNQLEESFDQLKLRLGIPPETPINLDLTELQIITARDEITVASELCRRALRNLDGEMRKRSAQESREKQINAAIQLAQTVLGLLEIQQTNDSDGDETEEDRLSEEATGDTEQIRQAQVILDRLQVESVALRVASDRKSLAQRMNSTPPPSPSKLNAPRINYINSLIELGRLQNIANPDRPYGERFDELVQRSLELSSSIDQIKYSRSADETLTAKEKTSARLRELQKITDVADRAEELLSQVESVIRVEERLPATRLVEDVSNLGRSLLTQNVAGLVPIELDVDEGMITALVTRFDLMNQRGALADAWRQIKLTGDDLRSVLNLRASQSIRTNSNGNRPFDFTFDDSQTRVGLTFDLPLNRRAQRNDYRVALIDYNVALRNLMQAEDEVKFNIRSDLRNLQLDREQYAIAVASAALARDRRRSTRAQLRLGRDNITARDVLEAQQAYTSSLNGVASAHIDYILDRVDLFLDLELLQVDETVFWPQLYDEGYQPEIRTQPPANSGPAYGRLVPRLRYSDCIRRMDCIPFQEARIFESDTPTEQTSERIPELEAAADTEKSLFSPKMSEPPVPQS